MAWQEPRPASPAGLVGGGLLHALFGTAVALAANRLDPSVAAHHGGASARPRA